MARVSRSLLALVSVFSPHAWAAGAPKNVLLFIVDDLRPEVSYMGEKFMHTPNIDKLAAESLVFNRAFCQQAICGPTRNSFLTSRRPQRTKVWNFIDNFREEGVGADWVSFPQYFKEHGYTALATGKTFHPGSPPNFDMPKSWDNVLLPEGTCPGAGCVQKANPPTMTKRPYVFSLNGYPQCVNETGRPDALPHSLVCPNDLPIEEFSDSLDRAGTLSDLQYASKLAKQSDKPFFITLGIHRPHLPWNIPQRFWDMYPETEQIDLPLHEAGPKDMPPIAFTYEIDGVVNLTSFEVEVPIPYPNASVGAGYPAAPPNVTRSLRKGYYAAVSFTDWNIGLTLDELERLGHKQDTIVALIGDHGWQLGEHNIWGKHSNFELGTRVPIIIRDPSKKGGIVSSRIVESIDLFPTVAALAGLPLPADVDGVDVSSLFIDPNPTSNPPKPKCVSSFPTSTRLEHSIHPCADDANVRANQQLQPHGLTLCDFVLSNSIAYSEYPRCAPPDAPWTPEHTCGRNHDTVCSSPQSCVNTPRSQFTVMGYSVRTDDWRYTEWTWWDGTNLVGNFSREPVGVELYPHKGDTEADFDMFENVNQAYLLENEATVKMMHELVVKQWKKE